MAYPLGGPRNNSDADADPVEAGTIPGQVSAITDDTRPRATLCYNGDAILGPAHVDVARACHAHVDDAMPAPAHIEDARPGPAHVDVTLAGPAHVENARPVPANVDDARPGPAHIDDARPGPVAQVDDARPSPANVDYDDAQPAYHPRRGRDIRATMVHNMPDSSSDGDYVKPNDRRRRRRRRRQPLAELVREDQLRYKRFMTRKLPKILRQLGVSASSQESDNE